MEVAENREDISVEKVRGIIKDIQYAESAVFSDNDQDFYVDSGDMNGAHKVLRDGPTKGKAGYYKLKNAVEEAFPETIDTILKTSVRLFGKIFMVKDMDENNNLRLRIVSGTAQDRAGRMYPIYFELNFGANKDTVENTINLITENPLYLKSIMERVFSPTSSPQDSYLRGNMNTLDRDNISPFVNLPRVSNIQTKTNV